MQACNLLLKIIVDLWYYILDVQWLSYTVLYRYQMPLSIRQKIEKKKIEVFKT